ncbi:spore germination lipoprotein GerD [Laceyella sacchari]|jgi:spore germination protein D|uniref:Spore germination lipoprotein GerD n=1 Tax=Laceyella sacchari TaxID=37482 RepID=A0ABY5U2L9_LACSH|nr:spore germination lipoprotein GerD [Laceyella sacchari]TCW36717.1 spore germination protein D [Laceyella sacchari]UWE03897.1 spore germination lipoprotein GerD [Laceyella sacchari]
MQRLKWIIPIIAGLFLISCNNSQSQPQEPDYQKIKEITLDVLHTSEGKKMLEDVMTDPSFKQKVTIDSKELETILAKSFTDQQTKKEWEKILQKETVAANLYKATEEQQKTMLKTMMKDPEYQKMMLDLLKDPQFSQHLIQLLKSQQARQEVQKLMEELVSVPSIQEKLAKKVKEALKQKEGEKQDQGGGEASGGDGGGDGGGEGGGGS